MVVGLHRELKKARTREDFITTELWWLLKHTPDFENFFLKKILPKIQLSGVDIKNCEWHIQYPFGRSRSDMVCILGEYVIIFEHKIKSSLSKNQIERYRNNASIKFKNNKVKVVLITKTEKQHKQSPDLALCWIHIYGYIIEWMNDTKRSNEYLFLEFLDLLKSEGIEVHPPISHKSILSHKPILLNGKAGDKPTSLEKSLASLLEHVYILKNNSFKKSIKIDFLLTTDRKKGNIYYRIWGRQGLKLRDKWNPDIFVGFLLDGKDHRTHPTNEARGPDFCLIIDIHKKFYDNIILNTHFENFIKNVEKRIIELNNGWEFYDHLKDKKK